MTKWNVRVALLTLLLLASLFLVPDAARVVSVDGAAQNGPVQTDEVDMQGNAFVPSSIVVLVGTTVTWTNLDGVIHSVTMDDGSVDHDPIAPAPVPVLSTAEITFDEEGLFGYFCKYHGAMVGEVFVVETLDVPVIAIEARDNEFVPSDLEVDAGQALEWTNTGDVVHNVVFEDPEIGAVGEMQPGESVQLAFEWVGTFRYRCTYHSTSAFETGMVGRIVSVAEDGAAPPTVEIHEPADGALVSGNVTIRGASAAGGEGEDVTRVEVRIGEAGDWDEAALEVGGSWEHVWDTTATPDGNVTVHARAQSGDATGEPVQVRVRVSNVDVAADTPTDATGTPGPHVLAALATGLAVAAWRGRSTGNR